MTKNKQSNFSESLGFFTSKVVVLASSLFDVFLALINLGFALLADIFDLLTGFIKGFKPDTDNKKSNKRTKRGR